jgi:hypothetical protein
MAKNIKAKKAGFGLDMKQFTGKKGNYIVFRLPSGAFHAFLEVEAKDAARDCGSTKTTENTREFWKELWAKHP